MSDDKGETELGFEKLRVWMIAMDIAVEMYAIADSLPSSERFGL